MKIEQTSLTLAGNIGAIEAMLSTPSENQIPIFAIVCHPHPLFGGTMHNKVVTTIAKALHELGITTLRFNFRGVGQSAGLHDEGKGETADVIQLLGWVKNNYPTYKIWLAGFSFGGYVATQTATQEPVDLLLTIAPQIERFHTIDRKKIHCPWLIIQGEKDETISPQAVYEWVAKQTPAPLLIRLPEAEHFFHGQLITLQTTLTTTLKGFINETT